MKDMNSCSGYAGGDKGGSCGPVGHGMSGCGTKKMGMGGKTGRRTKAVPGMYYSDGMGGMSHAYTGMDGCAPEGNAHEFMGGKPGKTPFLKKLAAKKGK